MKVPKMISQRFEIFIRSIALAIDFGAKLDKGNGEK